jgi:hypothetical protein
LWREAAEKNTVFCRITCISVRPLVFGINKLKSQHRYIAERIGYWNSTRVLYISFGNNLNKSKFYSGRN